MELKEETMNGEPNMLYNHFTEKLIGLQGLKITNIENEEKTIIIYAEMERKEHTCICCGATTDVIHDYRKQNIKDIFISGKEVIIVLKKRRYRCPNCNKRFYEDNTFLPKYYRMTSRLICFIIDKLRDERSFTSVAKEFNLSVSTVIRIFDIISYTLYLLCAIIVAGTVSDYECAILFSRKKTEQKAFPLNTLSILFSAFATPVRLLFDVFSNYCLMWR